MCNFINKSNTVLLTLSIIFKLLITIINGAVDESTYIFETNELRSKNILPTLSNGYLAFTVYDDTIHVNGIYNGFMGQSHRARIPNYASVEFEYCGVFSIGDHNCKFTLDMKKGYFKTVANYQADNFTVELITYPHRLFDRTIITTLKITRNNLENLDNFYIRSYSNIGTDSVDLIEIGEEQIVIDNREFTLITWETRQVEDPYYQTEHHRITVLYQTIPDTLTIPAGQNEIEFLWITTIGYTRDAVIIEMGKLLTMNSVNILNLHILYWQMFWSAYGISVEYDDNVENGEDDDDIEVANKLTKTIHASLFYLCSSLPSSFADLVDSGNDYVFHGLSPSGLGKGGTTFDDYQGHTLWDTEIWMHPILLLLEPKWSKALLHYRYLTLPAAKDNAKETKFQGARYPWESGYTGREVVPAAPINGTMTTDKYRQHVTGDVAFAVKQHFFATHDIQWLYDEGCEIMYETAKFWESKITYNETTKYYDILGVAGPDTDHFDISNNAYTNVIAGYNLYFAEFTSCICHEIDPEKYSNTIKEWSSIAQSLKLIHDPEADYYLQYEEYKKDILITEADAILLNYPLQYKMTETIRRNILEYYESVTLPNSSPQSHAMYLIGHLDVNDELDEQKFRESYEPYLIEPFYVWNDRIVSTSDDENQLKQDNGNYISAAGAFLQLIVNGFAGIRIRNNSLEIRNPRLPPNTKKLHLQGIRYLTAVFSMKIYGNVSFTIHVNGSGTSVGNHQFYVNDEAQTDTQIRQSIFDWNTTIVIRPKDSSIFKECQLPKDVIGLKVSKGNRITFKSTSLISLIILFLFLYHR